MSDNGGTKVKGYELRDIVGSGGFGTVYHAYQSVIEREVAVKVIREKYANQPQFIRRFESEARIIARLEHPHIVPLYDYWREPDGAYLVMRWLNGGSLRSRMKRERFPLPTIIRFLNQIAEALALAHDQEIIHRDIKPENILLDDQVNAYLTDFGIAVDLLSSDEISMENMSYGSPEYVAPEQLIEKQVTHQSDIYSLGIMLYELLAQARPFSGQTTQEIVKMQVRNPVPSLKLTRPDLPTEIDEIIWQATAKKPQQRYSNVLALAEAFEKVANLSNRRAAQRISKPVAQVGWHSTDEDDLSTGQFKSVDALGTMPLNTGQLPNDALGTMQIGSDELEEAALGTAKLPSIYEDEAALGTAKLPSMAYEDDADTGRIEIDTADSEELTFRTRPLAMGKPPNPYKGLRPFEEEDAHNFFGREELVERLLGQFEQDAEKRFLVVIGASGSGKSSLVRAGLIPAIRRGAIPGSEQWYVTTMVPGVDPLESLSEALLRVAVNPPSDWDIQLRERIDGLHNLLASIMPESGSELLLFIDQFEEVFTLCPSEQIRQQFLNMLHHALILSQEASRLRLILTLRADFYDRPLEYEQFGGLLSQHTQVILPLTEQELQDVITLPAQRNNIIVADRLVNTITADVRSQPGALPLLQYALTEMYDRTEDNTLPYRTYEEIGGISGALAQRASEIYAALSENEKALARQLFLRLVSLGADARATRRRVLWGDLRSGIADTQSVNTIIDKFSKSRLLTLDSDPTTRSPTVEIAHEALIAKWEQFQEWIDQNRADLLSLQKLREAVDEWLVSQKDSSYLSSGTKLAEFEALLESQTLVLSEDETSYIQVCIEQRERVVRRTRFVIAALVVFSVVTLILAILSVINRNRAVENEQLALAAEATAVANEQVARSRALAANAMANLNDNDLALLMSIEALRTAKTYEATNSLLTSLQVNPYLTTYLHGHSDEVRTVAYSPDGRMVASAGLDNTIRLWDTETATPIGEPLTGHTQPINRVVFSPDGTTLASASRDGSVRLWSVATREVVAEFDDHQFGVWGLAFSPDGTLLASSDGESAGNSENTDSQGRGTIIVWNIATGEIAYTIPDGHAGLIYDLAFSPDGTLLASAGDDNLVRLWAAQTGEPLAELEGHNNWVLTLAFSPDGKTLASSGVDTNLAFWNVESYQLRTFFRTGHRGWVRDIAYSADGSFIATASQDGTARLWTPAGQLIANLTAHTDDVWSVAFHPQELRLVTGSADHDIALWQPALPQRPGQVEADTDVAADSFSADDKRQRFAVFSSEQGKIQVWEAATKRILFNRTERNRSLINVLLSPDGQIVAVAGNDGLIQLYNVDTGELLAELKGHESLISTLAFMPDGSQLFSADESGAVFRWDLSDYTALDTNLRGSALGGVTSLAVSPDGHYLAIGGRDTLVHVWDLETEEPVGEPLMGHQDSVDTLIFDKTNTRLISGARGNAIIVWNFLSDNPLERRLEGHTSFISDLAISPNNRYLASASNDNTVRLWDLETASPMGLPFIGHQERVTGVLFLDDQTLLSTGHDRTVIRWNLNMDDWINRACVISNRNLSPLEWSQFMRDMPFHPTCQD